MSQTGTENAKPKGLIKTMNFIMVFLAIAMAVGGFFAGMKYQQSRRPSIADFPGNGRFGQRGLNNDNGQNQQRPAGSAMVRGEIIKKDESTITVKLADDSSKIVFLSENTAINKATEGSADDLVSGGEVMVFGNTNSDGSISASQIQLNFGLESNFNQTD